MTNYFANTYGGVALGNAVATLEESRQVRGRTATRAGLGGRYSAGSLFDSLTLTLAGTVKGDDPGTARDAWDALKGLFQPGLARPLVIADDRYVNAEVVGDMHAEGWKGLPVRQWSIVLASYEDPPWWAVTPTTRGALALGANVVTTAGNGPSDPTFSIPVTAVGGSVQISDAGGNSLTLTPDATGTYLVDSFHESITLAGADKTGCLTAGEFLRLQPGANTLTFSVAGGFAYSACSATWQDRFY